MEKIILDTDFIIAYLLETDSNHEKAISFLNKNSNFTFTVVNLVKFETANVLSRLLEQKKAVEYFETVSWDEIDLIWIDNKIYHDAFKIYKSETRKNISITDCVNLSLAKLFKQKIASFDKFYPKEIRI